MQRNRIPPKRYGDYRGYLIEIEELNEEELIYNEADGKMRSTMKWTTYLKIKHEKW